MATGRRFLGAIPKLTRRAWEDVAQPLEDFLRRLWDSEADGIPAGFNDEIPQEVLAPVGTGIGDSGTEGHGWAAADHKHIAPVDSPSPVGVELAEDEGTSTSLSRADHRHETQQWRTAGLTVDGGPGIVSTGMKGYIAAPYSGTITEWSIRADPAGSCVFDVWKNWRTPSIVDSICGASKPTLSADTSASGNVTGWSNLTVTKGDIFAFNVDSASTVRVVTLVVKVRETA